jgi:hypothetical protein
MTADSHVGEAEEVTDKNKSHRPLMDVGNHNSIDIIPAASKTTLTKILQNILDNPDEIKYQKVRLSNAQVQAKIASIPAALSILEHAGYVHYAAYVVYASIYRV